MFKFPEKMLRVFRDERVQETFERNGYVVLPFYNEEEIKELEALYYRLHPRDEKGFFPSTFSKDKRYRQEADREIRRIGQRGIDLHCVDVKVVCGSFIVKSPGPESGMCVHQDMSLVDESRFTGINIWTPLIDLNVENGTLFVLPGSHRIFPTYRGSSIPEFFVPVMDDIIDYLHPVCPRAGEAIFFDQSIIHFSPPNYSDRIRIVTNIYFAHQDTEFRTYYWNPAEHGNQHLEAFAQDDTFMTDFEQFGHNIHDRPRIGRSLGLVEYNFPTIDKRFLEERFTKTNARELIARAVPPVYRANTASGSNPPKHTERKNIFQRIKDLVS
ncbi:MAG: phytanoyl-CoA dioxygenase family protein [Chitinophagales bacterium]|nr:phytanoyl-CoA dioxygenase family protein [Chitinophagales bacterium]MDW8419188.1 phytanoyl-CoA dioxygenase family protein [Chitinophagales bacterium]